MLAKLLPTLCLVALVACFDDDPFPILRTMGINLSDHITVSLRVLSADVALFKGPNFYMSKGECFGLLDTTDLCGSEAVRGIEVKVSDPASFARVNISENLNVVSIARSNLNSDHPYCPDMALVDIRLSCDHWTFTHSRNRVRLASADSHSSDSSESPESSESSSGSSDSDDSSDSSDSSDIDEDSDVVDEIEAASP